MFVYVVKEGVSFRGGRLVQLMGVARNTMCTQAVQTSRKKAASLLVAYVETGTNT